MAIDQARKEKLETFLAEIKTVCDKYQMRLVPYIEWSNRGAFPRFTVQDTLPPPPPKQEETGTPENNSNAPVDNEQKDDVPLDK